MVELGYTQAVGIDFIVCFTCVVLWVGVNTWVFKGEDATAFSDVHDNQVRETEIIDFAILAQELEAQGKLEDAQETREEVERLKEQVAEFKEAYGQDFDEQIKNLAVEYEQTTDGNAEAYFTLLTLAEGAVLLNGVKALVAKVGGTEALKIIAKETAMSIKDAGAFVNDLVRGRGFGNVRPSITNLNSKKVIANSTLQRHLLQETFPIFYNIFNN
jgi:polyhydroxyalkanoate synthesis regulator phasin